MQRHRPWVTIAVFAGVLAGVVAGGYALHAFNRERAVEQFSEFEQHTADENAALLQGQLTSAAHMLLAVAGTVAGGGPKYMDDLLTRQSDCEKVPCATAATEYDLAGRAVAWSRRRIDLGDGDRPAALAWARDPAHARSVRGIITSPHPASLVLLTPLMSPSGAGPVPRAVLAVQFDLDALFTVAQAKPGPAWSHYTALVMKEDGTVVFHSAHPEMRLNNVHKRTARCQMCHTSFDHIERMLTLQRGVLAYRSQGVEQIAAFAPLVFQGEQWILSVRVPRDQVTGLLTAELWEGLALLSIIVGLVVAGGTVSWRDGERRLRAEADARQKAQLEASHAQLTAFNARLELAAHEWRATADTIDAALVVLEPSGSILRMNVAAAATLPDTLSTWLDRPSTELAPHAPWGAALGLAREAFERAAVSTARAEDAESGRTWDLWCRPMKTAHPRPAVVILARDITEVVTLQESLRRTETMAALGSVVVGVAHEVRNPLFAISSLVDAWAQQPHRDSRPFVDALRGEVERLRTLMVDLLEYGKPSKSVLQPRRLREVVDGAIRACVHEAAARRVRIVPHDSNDADVAMDARRIERVFINVIQNAVQLAPADSDVDIDVLVPSPFDPGRVDILVRDRGRGFSSEDLSRLFTPFFSRRPGGFGLGLAITERIVAEHQGRVTAANAPGGGAVMTISLPILNTSGARPDAVEVNDRAQESIADC